MSKHKRVILLSIGLEQFLRFLLISDSFDGLSFKMDREGFEGAGSILLFTVHKKRERARNVNVNLAILV